MDEYFAVDTKIECDDCHETLSEHLLNVTIPSLLTAKKLFLWGYFSRYPPQPEFKMIEVDLSANQSIWSISFPKLKAVQESIVIGSEQALNVQFDSLQKVAHGIWLSWAINSWAWIFYSEKKLMKALTPAA